MTINMLDKILSYASSFGTFISAIAALYAIWLTIFQRRISYKPILIIKDYYTQTSTDNFTKFDFDVPNQESQIHIELNNIGLGTAVSLKYYWEYDVYKGLEQYHSLFQERFRKNDESFIFDGKNNSYKFIVGNSIHQYFNINSVRDIDFVLPYNSKITNTLLELPHIPITVMENINFLMILNRQSYNIKIKGPKLVVEFQDIEGKITINKWESNLERHYFSLNSTRDIECNYVLRFTPMSNGWTQRRLQKIRKSYADYMNEHYYNKNR